MLEYMYVDPFHAMAVKERKGCQIPQELELRVDGRCHVGGVLGIKSKSFAKEVIVLNH